MTIRTFPLASGLRRDVDIRLLPDGLLHDAVNVELDRAGRMVVRPNYTAVASTVYGSGTLVAFDIFSLNDRLFCLGDAHSYGFPCDVYELIPSGAAARWRPSSTNNANSPRLPRATKVREIARPPDQAEGVENWGCAAFGGYACIVWNTTGNGSQSGYVHVVSAAEDSTVVLQRMNTGDNPRLTLRVIALSDRFLILGTPAANTALDLARFIPASDETVTDVAQDLFTGGAITVYAAARVAGSSDFVVIAQVGSNLITRRFSNVGVQQAEYSSIAVTATAMCIEASSTANQVNIGYVVSGDANWVSYNLTTGATIDTDTTFTDGSDTVLNVGIARVSSTEVMICASVDESTANSEERVEKCVWTPATSSRTTVLAFRDMKMVSTPVFDVETFFASQYGSATVGGTPNFLISIGSDTGDVTPQMSKDFEVAETNSTLLPDIALDSSTEKYYWANVTANPDGTTTPQLTEFELSSTERRQVAVLGNLAYLAGGCPLVFDGQTVVESGFLVRPRIIALTSSNSTGELISEGEYDYRLHWEWIDCQNNLHLSPPSAISSVTLGASDDTVSAIGSTAHSMRANNGATPSGTAHAVVFTRTLATEVETAATVIGGESLDPPATSLNGLTLNVLTTVAGTPDFDSVTFGAGDTSAANIVSTINAAFSGATASAPAGTLVLTHDTPGENNYLSVAIGAAATALGFPDGTNAVGTTSRTKGQNFQRAAVGYTSTTGVVVGNFKTVTDTRKDQSDPIVDSDLIRQQPLYSTGVASGAHHAPPPCEYIWAGRERIVVNHPRRARFATSKLVVPSEPAEFAAEGFIAFSGQVTGDIEGIVVLGDSIILFTRREIWEVSGSGPGRNGIGEFFAARRISNAGGLVEGGWKSLVETDEGVFFQRDTNQLCMLSKAGAVEEIGEAIEDYLDLYPRIEAAVYIPSKHSVAFACVAEDGLTGGILRYDLTHQAWFFDNVGAVSAMAEHQGRIAYVQSGIVYLQDEEPGVGSGIVYSLKTNMFQGFQTIGWGQLNRIGLLVTYRGECTVRLYLSEDGVDYSGLIGTWSLTEAANDSGDRLQLLKDPPKQMLDSFSLLVEVTPISASEGVWIHAIAVDVDGSPEMARRGGNVNR